MLLFRNTSVFQIQIKTHSTLDIFPLRAYDEETKKRPAYEIFGALCKPNVSAIQVSIANIIL